MKFSTKLFCLPFVFSALTGCGNQSPKLIPQAVFPNGEFSESPKDFTAFNPKVDILFVIDNSGSMSNVQNALSRNASLFADGISTSSILDFHIGVTSTDMDYCSSGGSSRGDSCGRLAGIPAFVDKTTPNMVDVLSRKIVLGTNGSATEQMYAPTIAALSPPMDTGPNAGFYRQDAFLAVIYITDADDQSQQSTQQLIDFLKLKKGDYSKVLSYGVIITLKDKDSCKTSEDILGKLEGFLDSVTNSDSARTNILSLCATDYGTKLAEFAKDIVKRSAGTVKLSRVPNVKTIRVHYGTQVIPNDLKSGWVYEPSTNSVLLAPGINWDISQGPTASLKVDFEVIDVQPK